MITISNASSLSRFRIVTTATITGTMMPGATVELFSDGGSQGRYVEGRAVADANGAFAFAKPDWHGREVTAIATMRDGSSSAFSRPLSRAWAFLPVAVRSAAK